MCMFASVLGGLNRIWKHTHTYNYLFVPIRGLVNLLNPSDMFLPVLQISEAHLHPSGFF